jgi:signal peptide peptidase SppA
MKDFNVLSYVGRSLWAITEDKWAEMVPALIRHAKGTKLTDDELQAFMGGREENAPPTSSKRGAVAIIPVRGMIAHRMEALSASSGGASCEAIGRMVDDVTANESIGTIVYDFDTPGGTVSGVPELAAKMFALRGVKKQIAMVQGRCCSGGYYLASQCDEIVATQSSEIGDIGVFMAHRDLSEALAKEGIKITLVKEGRHKAELNPFMPLSPEALANMEERVAHAYGEFLKAVARGRGVTPAAVKSGYGEGRSLVAKDAKAAGLIDRIATMDETLARLVGKSAKPGGMRAEDAREAINEPDPVVEKLVADVKASLASGEVTQAQVDQAIADELHERLSKY